MGRKQIFTILSALLVLGFVFSMVACGEGVYSEGTSETIELANDGAGGIRESDSSQVERYAESNVDLDDYSLVLKDNENYYYCLNRKSGADSRCYFGKAYYKRGSVYNYRGDVTVTNRSDKALAIYYMDCRYDKLCLTSAYWESGSGRATVYYEPTNHVWALSVTIYSGNF